MYIKLKHDKFSLIIALEIIASKGFNFSYSFLILNMYYNKEEHAT